MHTAPTQKQKRMRKQVARKHDEIGQLDALKMRKQTNKTKVEFEGFQKL